MFYIIQCVLIEREVERTEMNFVKTLITCHVWIYNKKEVKGDGRK